MTRSTLNVAGRVLRGLLLPLGMALAAGAAAAQGPAAQDPATRLEKAVYKLQGNGSTATGWIVDRAKPGAPAGERERVLITAKHVFEKATGEDMTLHLRSGEGDAPQVRRPVSIKIRRGNDALWTGHPKADVAALRLSTLRPEEQAWAASVPAEWIADPSTLEQRRVRPGDAIRALGYPHQVEANAAGYALIRAGCLGGYPVFPQKSEDTVFVDANTFEGDSGGLIYWLPGHNGAAASEDGLILGLVSGQHFLDEEVQQVYGYVKMRHRMGLAVVAPGTAIRETLDAVK